MITQGSVLFYFIFPFFIMLLALSGYKGKKMGRVLLVILLFFSMFRGKNVGNDTKTYMAEDIVQASSVLFDSFMENGAQEEYGRKTEIVSLGTYWIVYTLDLPPRTIICVFSIIQMLFLFYAFKRLNINTSLGLSLYVLFGLYFFSLSAARQMAAVSVFIFGATFIFESGKKKYLFFPYVILASLIHTSAIFFIWVFFLPMLKVKRKSLIVLMSIICLFMVITSVNFINYFPGIYKINYLSGYEGLFTDTSRTSIFVRVYDLINYLFFIYLFSLRKGSRDCDNYDLLFGVAVILMALFSHSSGLLSRVSYYLIVFNSFYVAKVLIDKRLLSNKEFRQIFLLYLLVKIVGMKGWDVALTSGYYLMF